MASTASAAFTSFHQVTQQWSLYTSQDSESSDDEAKAALLDEEKAEQPEASTSQAPPWGFLSIIYTYLLPISSCCELPVFYCSRSVSYPGLPTERPMLRPIHSCAGHDSDYQ